MKTRPIVPAALARDAQGLPFSSEYGDVYHPRIGALAQAHHVFLGGNELPARWRGRERFVILETGFGLGNNFLATWQAWREDTHRCTRLTFVSIERHPLTRAALREAHAASPLPALAAQLADAWPALTPNLHRLAFESGRVELLLALGDVQDWLPELRLRADAFYLDGFAPARNPQMWDRRVCKALGRLAAPGATLATWSAAAALRADLTAAGFTVQRAEGIGGKRDITLARFEPRFRPRHAPRGADDETAAIEDSAPRRALVIGAGLAGCAVAWALAEQGWESRLIERREALACEGSGNPAGLFHGIVNADDGTHARFNRAASFAASREIARALAVHGAPGRIDGVLRLEPSAADGAAMRALLQRLGLPEDYVRAVDAREAAALCGLAPNAPAWFYPGGGWVAPGALARAFVERAGAATDVRPNADVRALRREGGRWLALDAHGAVLDSAPVLVLANAAGAARLLPPGTLPLHSLRGQLSWVAAQRAPELVTRIPLAGAGYLLPPLDGHIAFGATSQPDDDDPAVRDADHAANLAKLAQLAGRPPHIDVAELGGRTGWRCAAPDRLPLIGALPALDAARHAAAARRDQARFVPREAGLFVLGALGSRGIGWAALGARTLAALVAGGVPPLEASLLDAVDPARFAVRSARRETS